MNTTMNTTTTSTTATTIAADWSVNETLLRHPVSIKVFNAFGVDSCCGGAATIAEAAAEVGIAPDVLLHALELATREAQ
jgi:iron-sulfur cluster repair protein YtfE (RIC family)